MSTVLVTGASGFVGAHTVRELLDRGHEVRAFVRTPQRLADALRPLGLQPEESRVEVVRGTTTDPDAVTRAVRGCDAVVHAAATFSYRRRDRDAVLRDNEIATRLVLEAGAAGCARVVHVSSTVALVGPGVPHVDHRSPIGPGFGPYSTGKVACERLARRLQEQGAPVSIVYPGGVLGPHDPYLGESDGLVLDVLRGRVPVFPRGRVQFGSVQDTAAVIAAAVAHQEAGRFVVPGHMVEDLHTPLRAVTGRRLPVRALPPRLAAALATPGYLTGWSFLPGAREGVRLVGCATGVDHAHTTATLGIRPVPLLDTLRATVRWLVEAGHLSVGAAGAAGSSRAPEKSG